MRTAGWYGLLLIGVLSCVMPLRRGEAVNPETLFMPGPLSAAHQKYEEDCSNCHDRSNRARESQLCSGCHKDIHNDIATRSGFHGRLQAVGSAQCRACHVEHQGRKADIIKLSREQLNHAQTDFALLGAHDNLTCDSCHRAGQPFRAAPRDIRSVTIVMATIAKVPSSAVIPIAG